MQVELNAGRYTAQAPYTQAQLDEQYNELAKAVARGVDTYWLSQPLHTGISQKHADTGLLFFARHFLNQVSIWYNKTDVKPLVSLNMIFEEVETL